MAVDPARTERRAIHAGTEYCFCSEACASAFAADPARYHGVQSARSELLLSDRGRDWATGVLRKAYEHDRISTEELERRLARLYVARTRRESSALLSDLPEYRRARIRAWRRGVTERVIPGLRRWRRRTK
jgi:YHS domain-containing protein